VCNHPEIFERRDFVSPLQMREYVLPSLPPPPTEMLVVNTINHSTVHLRLPALIFNSVSDGYSLSLLNWYKVQILTQLGGAGASRLY
jgi:hypothetical protein